MGTVTINTDVVHRCAGIVCYMLDGKLMKLVGNIEAIDNGLGVTWFRQGDTEINANFVVRVDYSNFLQFINGEVCEKKLS